MRLKSEIWVHAFLRRCQTEGIYGAVVRKGAPEAGAVYVIVNHLDGTHHFFGPAPGPAYDEDGERRWIEEIPFPARAEDITRLLNRRMKSDPDIWVVEAEDRKGTAGLAAARE
jgi:hypothetical protein